MELKDVLRHELIGLNIEVKNSKNPGLIGLKGNIVDETKNTLVLETEGKGIKRIKKILKSQVKIIITIGSKKVMVDGNLLIGRPEDRLKKIHRT